MASRRRILSWLAVPVALLAAWIGGLVWFASTVPERIEDTTTRSDAIVVLTGGRGRLEVGLALLHEGLAGKLFVTGVERGIDLAELMRLAHQSAAGLECCVELGHKADSTLGNAVETADWMEARHFRSLRLVTANFHMRRSLLEFRHAMPDIAVIPNPVIRDAARQGGWWTLPGPAHLIVIEYAKYQLTWLRQFIEDRLS
jgi:uncharacterized SAM-binding protein YcdF (DUF218 family)